VARLGGYKGAITDSPIQDPKPIPWYYGRAGINPFRYSGGGAAGGVGATKGEMCVRERERERSLLTIK